jgi:hypothetical protein
MFPLQTLSDFDVFLQKCGLTLTATIVGGTALALLNITQRQTRDVDVLHPDLSKEILEAAKAFAALKRAEGESLDDDWLNNGPAQLKDVLPENWDQHTRPAFLGTALTLTTLGRADRLKTKLFGLCDRATDLADCIALNWDIQELSVAQAWVELQDGNPDWPAHARNTFNHLRKQLKHAI